MLGGIAPIVIFNFSKLSTDPTKNAERVPVVAELKDLVTLPSIPVYLDLNLTGISIDSENKAIDIETNTDTAKDGSSEPTANQKPISSVVSIQLEAQRDAIGIVLISALLDLIYTKLSSKEYSITYLNGATSVFNGLLHNYTVQQNANNDLCQISIQLIRNTGSTQVRAPIPVVPSVQGAIPTLGGGA